MKIEETKRVEETDTLSSPISASDSKHQKAIRLFEWNKMLSLCSRLAVTPGFLLDRAPADGGLSSLTA